MSKNKLQKNLDTLLEKLEGIELPTEDVVKEVDAEIQLPIYSARGLQHVVEQGFGETEKEVVGDTEWLVKEEPAGNEKGYYETRAEQGENYNFITQVRTVYESTGELDVIIEIEDEYVIEQEIDEDYLREVDLTRDIYRILRGQVGVTVYVLGEDEGRLTLGGKYDELSIKEWTIDLDTIDLDYLEKLILGVLTENGLHKERTENKVTTLVELIKELEPNARDLKLDVPRKLLETEETNKHRLNVIERLIDKMSERGFNRAIMNKERTLEDVINKIEEMYINKTEEDNGNILMIKPDIVSNKVDIDTEKEVTYSKEVRERLEIPVNELGGNYIEFEYTVGIMKIGAGNLHVVYLEPSCVRGGQYVINERKSGKMKEDVELFYTRYRYTRENDVRQFDHILYTHINKTVSYRERVSKDEESRENYRELFEKELDFKGKLTDLEKREEQLVKYIVK